MTPCPPLPTWYIALPVLHPQHPCPPGPVCGRPGVMLDPLQVERIHAHHFDVVSVALKYSAVHLVSLRDSIAAAWGTGWGAGWC